MRLRSGDFRAHDKVCISIGISILIRICPLVGKVCVRIRLGAGFGIEVGVGARRGIRARTGVGFQLGTGYGWGREAIGHSVWVRLSVRAHLALRLCLGMAGMGTG